MAKPSDLSAHGIKALKLSPQVESALAGIQAELADAYREGFIEMVQAMSRQASALDRIQLTLQLLVQRLDPQLAGEIPPAIRVAGEGESPDLASAVVVADPIATGYTLSQAALAKALGLGQTDVSILTKAFRLPDDGSCAVTVRKGSRYDVVNYHARAIERFKKLVADPPALSRSQQRVLERVKKQLIQAIPNR